MYELILDHILIISIFVFTVPLVEITEIREGWKTDTFNKVSSHTEKLKEKGGGKLQSRVVLITLSIFKCDVNLICGISK